MADADPACPGTGQGCLDGGEKLEIVGCRRVGNCLADDPSAVGIAQQDTDSSGSQPLVADFPPGLFHETIKGAGHYFGVVGVLDEFMVFSDDSRLPVNRRYRGGIDAPYRIVEKKAASAEHRAQLIFGPQGCLAGAGEI